MQPLPGFREIFPDEYPLRRYLFQTWRSAARLFGFREYDAPTLEPSSLYEKKNSGSEILEQLYRFTDRGGRDISLRPELTPSLARMLASRAQSARKPLRWFSIGNFFRYERQQRGRLREFVQFNADIAGEASPTADAELIALAAHILRQFHFTPADVVIRLSSRNAWSHFASITNLPSDSLPELLAIVDKLERDPPELTTQRLRQLGIEPETLHNFLNSPPLDEFQPLLAELRAYGCAEFVQVDLRIVRGLAYYTGFVFEIFDRSNQLRAIAGGGRYDQLVRTLSDGAADLPAVGLGMGDVVLAALIEQTPHALEQFQRWQKNDPDVEIFLILAEPSLRPHALRLASELRCAGRRVEVPLAPAKVGKQFAAAEAAGATWAVLIGAEWPNVKLKHLPSRSESLVPAEQLLASLSSSTSLASNSSS